MIQMKSSTQSPSLQCLFETLKPQSKKNLEVYTRGIRNKNPSRPPLCIMLNARSLYNKRENFKTLQNQIGPDLSITSETWERKNQNLDDLVASSQYKAISYARRNGKTGVVVQFSTMKIDLKLTSLMSHHQMEQKLLGQFSHQLKLIMKIINHRNITLYKVIV